MVQFEDEFFKGEVIDGFYVQPIMKRIWACYINILSEVDAICKRHGIKYIADYGTVLGAIRHKGFIPWDDDVDITMRRKDFMKFIKYAKGELPPYLVLQNTYENSRHPTRVNYLGFISTSPDVMELRYGSPYACGIDIFILDNLPTDQDELQLVRSIWALGLNLSREWDQDEPMGFLKEEKWELLEEFEKLTGQTINREKSISEQLAFICDRLGAIYYEDEAEYGAIVLSYFISGRELAILSTDFFEDTIDVPFHNIMISVPRRYEDFLVQRFGDWRTPIRGIQDHNYPCFRNQIDLLRNEYEKRGASLPEGFDWDDNVNKE